MEKEKASANGKLWLKNQTCDYRASVLFLTVFLAFSTLFSIAFAYMVRYLINSATDGNFEQLVLYACILLSLLIFRILLKTFYGYFSEKLRAKVVTKLRVKIFSKILRSDYAILQKYHTGDMLNRLTSDIQEVAVGTVGWLPSLVGMIVQCVGAVVALLTINPLFTLFYIICGAVLGGITTLFRKQVKKTHKEVLQTDGELRSFMQEGLASMLTIKAYSAEDRSTDKADAFAQKYYTKRMKRNVLYSCMNAVFSLLSNFGLILAIVWCGISVLYGNNDYGSLLSVVLLLMQLQQPFTSFSSIISAYYTRIASAERLAELDSFSEDKSVAVKNQHELNYDNLQEITLKNVHFTYGRDDIFVDATYTIDKGKIVCITGPSGSGKSTLFKLLLNVFKPNDGKIHIKTHNNQQLIELTEQHRNLFAYVPQGHFLFSGTIYENLTFFSDETNTDMLNEKVKDALTVACADFVWEFPEGLQTSLSEGGVGLSEGQMQRLAVARAILSDRPILLLDEATSALDSETEIKLLENIRRLQNKTCLIVTHRPAALNIADEIITIENHKINRI